MILSVTNQPIGKKTIAMPRMKYQLPATFTVQLGSRICTAGSVTPRISASMGPGMKLAENPPETPAKAAAMPAIG
jgi:hypothetical protein